MSDMTAATQDGPENMGGLGRLADVPLWTLLLAVFAIALGLRLIGLGVESLSHPEIYVPGIDLPPGISEPPPRHTFLENLWWHFHDEPHPMGWYLAMFGWTSLAGTTETALRLPSALFGAGAAALMLLLGRRIFGPGIALFAAVLLCLHGFHIFWSQNARMYTAGVFLGLLATLLLLRLASRRRASPGVEAAYVATCVAGVQTVEFFWPFLLMQVAWVSLAVATPAPLGRAALARPHLQGPRLLQVQGLALALGAPSLLHSVYRARGDAAGEPSWQFFDDYFSFGFLMTEDHFYFPSLLPNPGAYWLGVILTVGLLLAAMRARARGPAIARAEGPGPLPSWVLPITAVAVALFMLWLASIAHRRNGPLAVTAALPIMAAFAPLIGAVARNIVARIPPLERGLAAIPPGPLLLWMLGIVPPLVMIAASFVVELLAARAFLIFVPYMLLLAAAGLFAVSRQTLVRTGLGALVLALFAMSVAYNQKRLNSPTDYKGLAAAMQPLMEPNDLVLVRHRHWVDTPLFYYLRDVRYVTENYAEVLAQNPDSRAWVVVFFRPNRERIAGDRLEALDGYDLIDTVESHRPSAELYAPRKAP